MVVTHCVSVSLDPRYMLELRMDSFLIWTGPKFHHLFCPKYLSKTCRYQLVFNPTNVWWERLNVVFNSLTCIQLPNLADSRLLSASVLEIQLPNLGDSTVHQHQWLHSTSNAAIQLFGPLHVSSEAQGHSVQIHDRYVDNIMTLNHLRCASGRPPNCTQYMCYTDRLNSIQ